MLQKACLFLDRPETVRTYTHYVSVYNQRLIASSTTISSQWLEAALYENDSCQQVHDTSSSGCPSKCRRALTVMLTKIQLEALKAPVAACRRRAQYTYYLYGMLPVFVRRTCLDPLLLSKRYRTPRIGALLLRPQEMGRVTS